MNKSDNLRAHLLTSISELKHDPDRLLIFIDNGSVRCTAATSLSFEYSYDLRHASEPQYTAYQDAEPVQVYANGELLAEWQPPQAGDAMALTTPHPRPDRHE
ncbi:phage tail protein [Pseudomonas sp. 10B1]|uniref:phage tail protein n=1 Tax=unclassified Pseudomonas TaxID=196821 RepID=UPI002AB3485C|nr:MULTISPECIES: phage tail protein [unclassified Pseudomonas]MDY7559745.1 phage tail protein [Pseudomonas sp. AB6]MEA9993019.1 phage tail protein [Pseudomonas sp. AA4]MEB0085961.1 phage tail protein [Pseudomonas sp. RTI1]MEB0125603.1 phage tail protein [Pseudomonas sp. CCC1.2]MEB0151604.1 phage tail protein [Pseudomonas sp. CCC4.3]